MVLGPRTSEERAGGGFTDLLNLTSRESRFEWVQMRE